MSQFAPPFHASRRRRVLYGFLLSFRLLRATWRAPAARRPYWRCVLAQVLVTVVLATVAAVGATYVTMWLAEQSDTEVTIDEVGVHVHQRISTDGSSSPDTQVGEGSGAETDELIEGMNALPESARLPLVFAYLLYGTLCIFEWFVIAMSRDYHDQIGRRVAVISGVPPEDPEAEARVRFNARWLWSKGKRRLRGLRVILLGLPVFLMAAAVPSVGDIAGATVSTLWTGYWISVFVGAKSALAWHDEQTAGDPWFIRAWSSLEKRSRLWRWWLPRAYGRLWRRGSQAVFAPCARFEETPWELAGLGLLRVLGGLPVFYLFVRPFIPVAAAHIISAHMPEREED